MPRIAELIWSTLTGSFLLLWLIGSAINQAPARWWGRIARFDRLGLLPRWTFFAPNPGSSDVHVVYRCFTADSVGPWVQVPIQRAHPWVRWIWNPDRYVRKAVFDCDNGIMAARAAHWGVPRAVLLSAPYLILLNWVTHQPRPSDAVAVQFALVVTSGPTEQRDMRVRFVSEAHRVPR